MDIYKNCPTIENDKYKIRLIEKDDSEDFYKYFGCKHMITKAAVFAVERIEALEKMNFVKSEKPLISHYQNREYYDYWIRHKTER